MGNELRRDNCPAKYTEPKSLWKDVLSTMVTVLIVVLLSGSQFRSSGMDIATTIMIEAAVVVVFSAILFVLFKGMKKRMAQTYISVCENGVCGVCTANGFKNKPFSMVYGEITQVKVKGERLLLYRGKARVELTLNDAAATGELIQQKIAQ